MRELSCNQKLENKYFVEVNLMKSKKINMLQLISLLIIGIVTMILVSSVLIGAKLPDMVIRILGVIDLMALPVLAFLTVKKKNQQ